MYTKKGFFCEGTTLLHYLRLTNLISPQTPQYRSTVCSNVESICHHVVFPDTQMPSPRPNQYVFFFSFFLITAMSPQSPDAFACMCRYEVEENSTSSHWVLFFSEICNFNLRSLTLHCFTLNCANMAMCFIQYYVKNKSEKYIAHEVVVNT